MKVVILESAQADLLELRSYIVKYFSVTTWQATYAKLKLAIRNLARFPQLGGIPDELETLNLTQYRQILSGMNRVIYEVRQDTVYVHLIVDTRRDLKEVLMQRLLR
jgi:plasmid stabilization system protein ParE